MSTSRILITGAGGFVGLHLARRIVERGDRALGVGIEQAPEETKRLLAGHWKADVTEAKSLEAVIREAAPTAIVHLAAQSSAGLSFAQPLDTFRANVLGTVSLLEATHHAAPAARVLVVGTSEIYGSIADGTRAAEDAPLRPVSPYALSKAAADGIAAHYATRGLDVIRTRSFGHFGPAQTDRFVVPSIARQIADAEAGRREPIVEVGNLEVTRDLTDVRDVVDAYLALLDRGRAGAAYNVCRGTGVRLAELARLLIGRARTRVELRVDPARLRPADISYLVGDPTAIAGATGWEAAIPLDQTLDDVLEEWRARPAPA